MAEESGAERAEGDDDPLVGEIVADRYRVDKLVAKGGFSSVYRATSTTDDGCFAIKVLHLDDQIERVLVDRFEREGRLVQTLQSPHTVRIFQTGKEDGYLFTVMEYIQGRSLYRQIRRFGALTARQTAEVAVQICDSLIEAHDAGFLHRDLKPSNVMLYRDDDGRVIVKVLDFGVAKLLEGGPSGEKLTQQGTFVGTPRYASPEQLRREPVGVTADVYALGLIMWECLTGAPAVPGREYGEAVAHHLRSDPWKLPSNIICPAPLRHIVEKSLAKTPQRRYQSCVEVRDALSAWLTRRYGADETSGHTGRPSDTRGEAVTKKTAPHRSETLEDLEAEDELFGEVIERSDACDDEPLEIMETHDLSESSAARAARLQIANRNSDHAGVTDADRPVRTSEDPKSNIAITIAVIIAAALAILYFVTMTGTDDEPEPNPTTATEEAVDPSDEGEATVDTPPVAPDSERGDGSPTLSADTIIAGMVASGWRVKNRASSTMDEVTQTNVLAEREKSAASVTIYESETWEWTDELKLGTEPPVQAISFGRTVVRLAGGPPDKSNGVAELRESLKGFKEQAMERAAPPADDDVP